MQTTLSEVTIIGAGLAGIALAIALDQLAIPCRIYEARDVESPELASGVVLTPNGLLVLHALGIYDRIKSRCWQSEFRTYKNDRDETTRKDVVANEQLYGYKNHRLYRRVLLTEMKLMLTERNIPVTYNAKFQGIISDNADGVVFQVNGRQERTAILVGADGIYSSVRKFLSPDVVPEYTGVVGVLSHIDRSTVDWPYSDYEKACTIQGKPGAIFFIPEVADGSEIMVGLQVQRPDQTRAGWQAMAEDKEALCDIYRKGYDEWHNTAKSIIDSVCKHKETLYLWPFLRMPKLERWFSTTGCVIIIGDAAHAVPPSSGQGVNQALEDIYSLTLGLKSGIDLLQVLGFWQDMRQKRIDAVYNWATNTTNVQRLPEAERNKLIQEGKLEGQKSSQNGDTMRWLYQPKLAQEFDEWIKTQG